MFYVDCVVVVSCCVNGVGNVLLLISIVFSWVIVCWFGLEFSSRCMNDGVYCRCVIVWWVIVFFVGW